MNTTKHGNQLFRALHQRYSKQIKHLILNEGISVNYQFPDGSFPLHVAAEKHDVETVKFLLSLNACPDYKNRHGETPLIISISQLESGMKSCVVIHITSALINKKCRVNLCDSQGRTALHLACSKGLAAVVRILIDSGAMVNKQDKWCRNPMHMTLLNISHNCHEPLNNFFQVVKILLANRCEINRPDQHKSTPLFLVASTGDHCIEIAQLLLVCGAYPDKSSRHGLTPLMVAVKRGYYKITKLLIQYNCNVNQVFNRSGKTCLFTACFNGYNAIARLLVASGCTLSGENWMFQREGGPYAKWKDSDRQDMIDWLIQLSSRPLTLKESCRIAIRRKMGTTIQKDLVTISYPESLKKFVLLMDVFEETDRIHLGINT